MAHENQLKDLQKRRDSSLLGGGTERITKQHAAGKLTARERLEILFDPGTFVETDRFVTHRCTDFGIDENKVPGDGVVTGWGQIRGRKVFAFSQDFTVMGGSLSSAHASKICKLMDLALKAGLPMIGLNDSGGARIQEGVESLGGYAEIFWRNVQASGVVPQISVVLGPCAGGAVYSPAITDFIFMAEGTSYMFVTGPDVIRTVTHEEIDKEALGGASAHAAKSGVCHFTSPNERACLEQVKRLLEYLPSNNLDALPEKKSSDRIDRSNDKIVQILPESSSMPYDMRAVIKEVVDDGDFLEVHAQYAKNIVVGFSRLGGCPIGVVGNQPMQLAGCLDINASEKAARFVRFCDAFNIPLVTFVDVPGFLPGVKQEHEGIIKNGAKLLYAYAEATVPKLTLITRKAYGGAYDVMASKHIRADLNLAYPMAEIAVMGPEGAVNILYREELKQAKSPEAARKAKVDEYRNLFANPYRAAELGYIDEVIHPKETRVRLAQGLALLRSKREKGPARKHGNIPL